MKFATQFLILLVKILLSSKFRCQTVLNQKSFHKRFSGARNRSVQLTNPRLFWYTTCPVSSPPRYKPRPIQSTLQWKRPCQVLAGSPRSLGFVA